MSQINNSRLNNCNIDLSNWMTTNYLFLNSNKTILLNISNKLSHFPTIYLDDNILSPQYSTKYLIHTFLYKKYSNILNQPTTYKKCIRPLRNSKAKLLTLPTINRKLYGCIYVE